MNPITLDPAEMAACRMMGNLRSHACRVIGMKPPADFGNDPYEQDENGFIGEYAFCKARNLFFDITGIPRSHGFDCIFRDKRIDVKTTHYLKGRLMVLDTGNKDVDIYVMAILDGLTVHFPGYCSAQRLKEEGEYKPNSNGTYRYEMSQDKLTAWRD